MGIGLGWYIQSKGKCKNRANEWVERKQTYENGLKQNQQRESEMAKHVRREHITGNNKLKKWRERTRLQTHKTRLKMTNQGKKQRHTKPKILINAVTGRKRTELHRLVYLKERMRKIARICFVKVEVRADTTAQRQRPRRKNGNNKGRKGPPHTQRESEIKKNEY